MDFVLTLHSHVPYVLYHGRWPHGSDWLSEAALDTYLPLVETLQGLTRDRVATPLTIGVTPVLAAQLADPNFVQVLEAFFEQRLTTCGEAPVSLASTNETKLLPLVEYWRSRFLRLRDLFRSIDGDLVGALRDLETQGTIELISSAATHGFLPLFRRDESIRLQLEAGRSEHERLFGRTPKGCWLPECAYRPRGPWLPPTGEQRAVVRAGIEEHLAAAGFEYFFSDAHLASAGPAGPSTHHLLAELEQPVPTAAVTDEPVFEGLRSPYRGYRVGSVASPVACLIRDPRSARQVWSRQEGYPGDEWYLEFHKIRWPGGLKLWRVSQAGVDLGGKRAYEPEIAGHRVRAHAGHFKDVLTGIALGESPHADKVIVAPFDTELFGHWWFEGVDFLGELYRQIDGSEVLNPVTAGALLDRERPADAVRLTPGSWGAGGDYSMWLNSWTSWTWERLGRLEETFWDLAPAALGDRSAHAILAQAARELLLAQSSDWQFIISTGVVGDYAERRFREHCENAERLIPALAPGASSESREAASRLATEFGTRNRLFPDVLHAVAAACRGTPESAAPNAMPRLQTRV